MKRLWIGVALLGVMLAAGVAMLLFSRNFYEDFSGNMEAAADAALTGQWAAAEELARQATAQWGRYHRFFASFTDHEPIEDVKLLLMKLELYQKARLSVDFADTCHALSQLCEAIDETHSLNWWSVL